MEIIFDSSINDKSQYGKDLCTFYVSDCFFLTSVVGLYIFIFQKRKKTPSVFDESLLKSISLLC